MYVSSLSSDLFLILLMNQKAFIFYFSYIDISFKFVFLQAENTADFILKSMNYINIQIFKLLEI